MADLPGVPIPSGLRWRPGERWCVTHEKPVRQWRRAGRCRDGRPPGCPPLRRRLDPSRSTDAPNALGGFVTARPPSPFPGEPTEDET